MSYEKHWKCKPNNSCEIIGKEAFEDSSLLFGKDKKYTQHGDLDTCVEYFFFNYRQRHQKFFALGSNFWEGTEPVGHATGMSFVSLLLAYQRGNEVSCGRH